MTIRNQFINQEHHFDEMLHLISSYRLSIDKMIKDYIPFFGPVNPLREACEYALVNGGKRFRPALVMMMAKALGNRYDVSRAALSVEFFHTASLIADDLPCMDDDDQRRNKPTLHKVYGETTALLASYALIAEGYRCIAKNSQMFENRTLAHQICLLALENATHNTGFLGATGGQFMDLYPPNLSTEVIFELIRKKTVTLFEISFVFGWLFGGGAVDKLNLIEKAAYHFGMAFQIADDLEDVGQDIENQRFINLAIHLGTDRALELFKEHIHHYFTIFQHLEGDFQELLDIGHFLDVKIFP